MRAQDGNQKLLDKFKEARMVDASLHLLDIIDYGTSWPARGLESLYFLRLTIYASIRHS